MQPNNIEEIKKKIILGEMTLGGGARFWVYLSPENDTEKYISEWEVIIQPEDGDWIGIISSINPQQMLQTPNLSGIFNVTVRVTVGAFFQPIQILPEREGSKLLVCNSNCAAMISITATPDGEYATYLTFSDAICKSKLISQYEFENVVNHSVN